MLDYLGIIIFSFFSILNLTFAFLENDKWRKKTKGFVVLSIICMIAFLDVNSLFIYMALIMGLLGDILMIRKSERNFVIAGLIAFGFNHIFYMMAIAECLNLFNNLLSLLVLGGIVVIICVCEFLSIKFMRDHKKEAGIYIGLLFSELMMCILFMIHTGQRGYVGAIVPLIGIIFFMFSDGYIAKTLFYNHDKREDFFIMLTYIIGQVLLCVGIGLF